jgi:ABC-type Zn2+ transport system substrate-binding protein/surface adhesin
MVALGMITVMDMIITSILTLNLMVSNLKLYLINADFKRVCLPIVAKQPILDHGHEHEHQHVEHGHDHGHVEHGHDHSHSTCDHDHSAKASNSFVEEVMSLISK